MAIGAMTPAADVSGLSLSLCGDHFAPLLPLLEYLVF